jgi:multidrug transporter EmrE-like cation transporter
MTVHLVAEPHRNKLLTGFLNAYVQIALGSLLTCAAELLLKKGAISAPDIKWLPTWFNISAMFSWWTWAGITCYILSMLSWLYVLRIMPLNVAYALVNVAQVLVPMGAAYFLHEHVSMRRWAGIALVLVGLYALLDTTAKAEQKVDVILHKEKP